MSWAKDRLVQLTKNFITSGMVDTQNIEIIRKVIMINLISLVAIANLFPLGFAAFSKGNIGLGSFDHFVAVLLIFNLLYLRKARNLDFACYVGISFAGALFFYLLVTGGVKNTGHLWYYTFPLFASFLLGSKRGSMATLILLLAAILFLATDDAWPSQVFYTNDFKVRFIPSFLVVFAYSYLFEHLRERTQRKLAVRNTELKEKVVELQEAEGALRESEEKYRNLVERANDGIALIQGSRLKYVNPRLAEITGYSPEEMHDSPFTHYLDPAEVSKVSDRHKNRIRGQAVAPKYETALKDKKGKRVDVELNEGVISYQGKLSDLVIVRDIRDRKRVEEELNRSRDAAEAANKAKSEFLATMSHELRTPLNHIIGFTEMVADKKLGDLNEVQQEYLRDVLQSSRHLLSLINDILDLSKVEAGKLELDPADVNISLLFNNSLLMVKEKALKRGIQLAANTDGAPEYLKADERKLKQIFYNLLSNAVKFTPAGGCIHVSARRVKDSELQVPGIPAHDSSNAHRPTIDYVVMSVKDTGIGIKPEDQDRIFDPFEQADGSSSRKYQGTGLGLSLTRKLVELHGGRMWVESEGDGKGSTFSFFLPLWPTLTI